MKILYGVCGEGMGHAVRSAVVGRHLISQGHAVEFVCSSGRAFDHLQASFGNVVHRTVGLEMSMRGNAVQPLATLAVNLLKQAVASPFAHIGTLLAVRRPDVIVSDFEPLVARYAGFSKIPLLALDNIHFMNRFDHLAGITQGDRGAAALMFAATSEMVPDADRYMVTSFVEAKPRLARTTIHLPILRDEILSGEKTVGDHVVVYLNDKADPSAVLRTLRQIPEAYFKAYCGSPVDAGGNVEVVPFSTEKFLKDFLSSKAVIGGAGFTLMTEAIYSQKPMLALPFEGQFEQILNANYLQRLGWGERARGITVGGVRWFLSRVDGYREKLQGLQHDRNVGLLQEVDGWIKRWST